MFSCSSKEETEGKPAEQERTMICNDGQQLQTMYCEGQYSDAGWDT
jgi:hypothetical protein